ncbi:DUF4012 domain-containing protein [Agromyces atrinae]|uniref:DUF4012 domain-containing protein n=1 Tax=Agromyces atrinae TaxID=592376 RepID=UPI001F5ABAA5|nr:DUF4012 domain-containing protein [Agromyces atrinae]MCI2956071.1 DUF4012 domain-containing protein [Agromyces atrinae]
MPESPTTDSRASRRHSRTAKKRTRRIWAWSIAGALVLIIGSFAWVGVRGFLATQELQAAMPLATSMKKHLLAQESEAAVDDGEKLAAHAAEAAALTGDPVWRVVELIPGLGPNLTVVRELAASIDDVASGAVVPLAELSSTIELNDFAPAGGRVDLQPMIDAGPSVSAAADTLAAATDRVRAVAGEPVVGPLADARTELTDLLVETSATLDALDNAVELVPAMLGVDGPRNYVLLFQNNAELRSTGGISGALALIHTDQGGFGLVQQASSQDFPRFDPPVVDLPIDTLALYGDNTARYIQDVNFTPQFPLAASLAREMWRLQFGLEADGVIATDPVMLSYLLEATGPVQLATGDVLTSENAVQLLLLEAYLRYPEQADQDAFFQSAAASVFDALASGSVEPSKLIQALIAGGEEHRILIWNAREDEQGVLADSTLAGDLPVSTSTAEAFGVYFNDSTGSKMDNFLDVTLDAGSVTCRNDGRPNFELHVTLTNTAPADAGVSLPSYITGGGNFGTTPGNIKTTVAVYGYPGSFNLGVRSNGAEAPYHPAVEADYTLSKVTVELAPGESQKFEFGFLGNDPKRTAIDTFVTPMINPLVTGQLDIDCESALF